MANKRTLATGLLAIALGSAAPYAAAQDQTQFIPLLSYRIGPFATGGISLFGGMIDYYNYINETGGVNGVRFVIEECETEYNVSKGVECYERLKTRHGGATVFETGATGIAYALMERAVRDKIPVTTVGYGRSDAAAGDIFPYVFPLISTYWTQADVIIQYLGKQEGGLEKLRGKKIVNLHHDSAYGKEPMAIFNYYSKQYGFQMDHVPVTSPGIDQQSQWSQIRASRADYVILWGWGVMNPTALRTAARMGFPREKIIGSWWAGSEIDTVPAGEVAEGYRAMTFTRAGGFPLLENIRTVLYAKGKGNVSDPAVFGSVGHVRGLMVGALITEAVRAAQKKFGVGKRITSEQMQWGLEHLAISASRQRELGFAGVIPEIRTSCRDHEGAGQVTVQVWKGGKWQSAFDGWIEGDRELVRKMVSDSASKYASENSVSRRKCD